MKYILIALIFMACNNAPMNRDHQKTSSAPLDTLQAIPPIILATPHIFETAFIKGASQKHNNSSIPLYGISAGNIKVLSGRIIACDPMHIEEYGKPFTQEFPKGEFPVELSIAKFEDVEEIAFARINFSNEPVERWAFALQEGKEQIPLGSKELHGYSVDAGVGAFIDLAAFQALDLKTVENSDGALYTEMDKNYRHDWRFAIYNFGNYNLAAFTSGKGDGYYATYIGFDKQGRPCRLLTDFRLFDWSGSK
jgi:hypothetical protein